MNRSTLLARVIVPLALIATAATLLVGASAAPLWIPGLGERLGIVAGPSASVRAAAALCIAFALCTACIGAYSLTLARCGLALLAFGGLATVAGSFQPGGPAPLLLAGGAGALFVGLGGLLALRSASPPPGGNRGASAAWRLMAGIGLTACAFMLASKAPIGSLPIELDRPLRTADGRTFVDLDLPAWEGRPLASSPLAEHLPELSSLASGGRTWIVLFNRHCGACHELFLRHFATQRPERVIAVEIPPLAGERAFEWDEEDIDCFDCERLELPAGIPWLLTPPTVLLVEEGVIRCVQEPRGERRCLE